MQRLTIGRILLNNLASYPDVMEMIQTLRRAVRAGGARLTSPSTISSLRARPIACLTTGRSSVESRHCSGAEPVCRGRSADAGTELAARHRCLANGLGRAAGRHEPDRRVLGLVARVASARLSGPGPAAGCRAAAYRRLPARAHGRWSTDAALHIGVVGEISFAKGAEVVAALHRELQHRQSPIKLSVIGTLDRQYAGRHPADRALPHGRPRGYSGGAGRQCLPGPIDLARDLLLRRRGADPPGHARGGIRYWRTRGTAAELSGSG